MRVSLSFVPGHGLTAAGGVIFVDVGGGWWIDFPVEAGIDLEANPALRGTGHFREVRD